MHYAYLIWSLLLLVPWLALFVCFQDQESRNEMLIISLFTAPLGITGRRVPGPVAE